MAIFDKKIEDKKKDDKKAASPKGMKDLYAQGAESKAKATDKAASKERKYGNAYKILIKPLVTEKASVAGAENKYVFEVSVKANKVEVAKAIKEVYGIQPTKVNIITVLGKKSRYGKATGKRKDWKKAVITLPAGQSIKVYEGV